MLKNIQLFIDEINELLPYCLWQIAAALIHDAQLCIYFMHHDLDAYRDELYRTIAWYAFLQGYYQKNKNTSIPIRFHHLIAETELNTVSEFLICPQSYSIEADSTTEEGLILSFSDSSLELFDQLEKQDNALLLEELLFNALEHHKKSSAPLLWLNEKHLEQELLNFLGQAKSSDASLWQDHNLSAALRCFIDMDPIRSIHLPQNIRTVMDQLIQRAIEYPDDENCQILLALLRRRLSQDFPDSPQLDQILSREQAVQILKPIENWTVSIVVVTYNRLSLLKRTLHGILNQTYSHWQLYILDHASTDGSYEYLTDIAQDEPRIKIIRKDKNLGSSAAINYYQELIDLSDSELVLINPDDDWMTASHLERLITIFQERPWMAMAYGSYKLVKKSGETHLEYGPLYAQNGVSNPYIELHRVLRTGICVQGALIRKESLKVFAQWDPLRHEEFSFGIFDALISIYLQCFFEAAHSLDFTYSVTFDGQSANALDSNLNGRWWLSIIQAIIRNFERLYSIEHCPYDKAFQHYYLLILDSTLLKLREAMQIPIEMDNETVNENQKLLQDLIEFCQQDLSRLSKSTQNLFQESNAYRDLN